MLDIQNLPFAEIRNHEGIRIHICSKDLSLWNSCLPVPLKTIGSKNKRTIDVLPCADVCWAVELVFVENSLDKGFGWYEENSFTIYLIILPFAEKRSSIFP
jgi:hypothetical protein